MQEDKDPAEALRRLAERVRRESENPRGKAWEAAESGRVVLLAGTRPRLWVVIGEEADYIVLPGTYCSCPHFMIRVLGEAEDKPCYHLVAVEAVRRGRAGRLVAVDATTDELADILSEALLTGRSRTLRRLLYGGDAEPRRS
ncbi:MAG: hypothetical protein GXO09_00465 [Crenarchaeota archaeon]|nr:hypothetical protein [Thermoproteota archaeon]